jgi:hypothetical protein
LSEHAFHFVVLQEAIFPGDKKEKDLLDPNPQLDLLELMEENCSP